LTSKADRSPQPREEQPTHTPAKGGVCPFVANPMPDCHCAQLTSLRIPQVLARCGGNFETCEIYRRQKQTSNTNDDA